MGIPKKLRPLYWWYCRWLKKETMLILVGNLTRPQKMAIEDMLKTWIYLGGIGASRWTAFYADGDGNFQPKILVNGKKPRFCSLLKEEDRWKGGMYMIDFDVIAWRIR